MKFDSNGLPIIAAPWDAINGLPQLIADLASLSDPGADRYLGWDNTLNELAWFTPSAGVAWGAITGTLSAQADLQSALDAKAAVSHTHAQADITGLVADLAAKAALAGATFTGQVVLSKSYAAAGDAAVRIASNVPVLELYDADAAADTKRWLASLSAGDFYLQLANDAENAFKDVLKFDRTANAITAMIYGNATDSPAHTFHGVISGVGSGITTLNASNVSSGTLASGRLDPNDGSWGGRTAHATYTSFESGASFTHPLGSYYVQGTTNGPGVSGATQYYNMRQGLGSEYTNTYAMDMAVPRVPVGGNPVLSVRFAEAGTWGAWSGIYAGAVQNPGATATILPNIGSLTYGTVRILGNNSGYSGLALDDCPGDPTFMGSTGGTTFGVYSQSAGYWSWYDDATYFRVEKIPLRTGLGAMLWHGSSSYLSGKITVQSGGSPSGGADGDIFLIY